METQFITPNGHFKLNRFPLRQQETLRAWDAGDELMINYLFEHYNPLLNDRKKILIINDQFGALSIALNITRPDVWNDSFISQKAIELNSANNNLLPSNFLSSTQTLQGKYDLVIIKIQKSLAQLEDQLHRLRPHLHKESVIVGSSMVKMLHNSTLNLFEKIIGPTKTSLAVKKARLIHPQYDEALSVSNNPHPQSFTLEQYSWSILNHANVFSRSKLDVGCRFFIENIPKEKKYKNIIDLGCGNGIVGMVAAHLHPEAQVDFYDESYMAIASAEFNYSQYFCEHKTSVFSVDDCLSSRPERSADLILNNPPFHQQNAIGDFIAWQMFTQAYKTLVKNGELWVIGNRHLQYQQKLKKIFNNCQQMNANNKFVVLRAIKTN